MDGKEVPVEPLPSVEWWGPTLPLLIGTFMCALCGLLLLAETVVVAARARGTLRGLAAVPLAQALAAFVLANQNWTAYLRMACPYNTQSHPLGCFDPQRAAQAVAQFAPLSGATVGVTLVLLVVGLLGLRHARHAAGWEATERTKGGAGMALPTISLYGPTWPLLIWTPLTAACGILLVLQAAVLVVRARGTPRWLAVVPLAEAIAAGVLANRIWLRYRNRSQIV
jgi:hypothetical protein